MFIFLLKYIVNFAVKMILRNLLKLLIEVLNVLSPFTDYYFYLNSPENTLLNNNGVDKCSQSMVRHVNAPILNLTSATVTSDDSVYMMLSF